MIHTVSLSKDKEAARKWWSTSSRSRRLLSKTRHPAIGRKLSTLSGSWGLSAAG